MKRFVHSSVFGLIVGAIGGLAGGVSAQSTGTDPNWNPYSSGNLLGELNTYSALKWGQLQQDDAARRQRALQNQQWNDEFARSLAPEAGPRAEEGLARIAERSAQQRRALEAETAAQDRAIDRMNRETDRLERELARDEAWRASRR
jgi:hypothetical protein